MDFSSLFHLLNYCFTQQRPNNVVNEVLQPAPQAQGGGGGRPYTGPEASEAKPHVMCPAAMLCVPRYVDKKELHTSK